MHAADRHPGPREATRLRARLGALAGAAVLFAACSAAKPTSASPPSTAPASTSSSTAAATTDSPAAGAPTTAVSPTTVIPTTTTTVKPKPAPGTQPPITAAPLPSPAGLLPFASPALPGEGAWQPAGRRVDGVRAVYVTNLRPPGSSQPAGIAWMDTRLLAARLYSGSSSPGSGPWKYTAPVEPVQAAALVAAFNGGFKMAAAGGGYFAEGRVVVPLRTGAASLVVYADGSVALGAWGSDVTMTSNVVAIRQNLVPLVAGGQPSAQAANWPAWGATIGNFENVWRSGVGITAHGALVYVSGPGLAPLQLAQLLVRAGAVRAMQLDINPDWTVLATYDPASTTGLASAANGTRLVAGSVQGPGTFFEPTWARDFVTMSARSGSIP